MYTQLEQRGMSEPPVNVSTLRTMKEKGEPIACLTAYDASYAVLVDAAGTDLVLVGDSLGMVIQGHDTTVPVTVDDIVYHSRAVARGLRRAFLVADMPFMSYANPEQALDNAVRLMQEGGAMGSPFPFIVRSSLSKSSGQRAGATSSIRSLRPWPDLCIRNLNNVECPRHP